MVAECAPLVSDWVVGMIASKLGKVLSTPAQIPHLLLLLDSHTSSIMTFYLFLFPRNKNGVTFLHSGTKYPPVIRLTTLA
jgi:hypothetical protein